MKKQLLSLLLLLFTSYTYLAAQDFTALQSIEFNKAEDYKTYEGQVLECANYVLSVPAEEDNVNRRIALQTLIKWMGGTPDYKFEVDGTLLKLMDRNESILGLGFASMTKYVLENKSMAANPQEVKYNAYLLLLTYCENSMNKIPQTKELKKAIAAKNKGALHKYLNI